MSTDLSNFAAALASSDLFAKLNKVNENLLSGQGGGGMRRLSLKGSKFREIVGGEQVSVSKDDEINIIILNAAPISRTYYEGTYDPNNIKPPVCWSSDTDRPDAKVPEDQRQARSCNDCKQNIKGSGQGNSRACRFGQRLAIALEGDLENVYQLQLPATSIFGDAEGGKMPMGAYARFLASKKMPATAIVTQMYFDEESEVPKVFFKPVRPLTEDELQEVVQLMDNPDVERAITLTVSEADGQKLIASDKPKTSVKEVTPQSEEDEVVEEPKKKASRKAAPEPADSLASLVAVWDDE